jgi:hypothetical protein
MGLLAEFLLRLSFGLAGGMALVSPRQVTSGYFRNHLYVTLGLSSLAALLCRADRGAAFWYAVAAAVFSYAGSVVWLYEKPAMGKAALWAVAAFSLTGAWLTANPVPHTASTGSLHADWVATLRSAHVATSGALLGVTMAAMLLGHWYLNAPGMQLSPLRRLLTVAAAAVVLHAVVCGIGLGLELATQHASATLWLLVALRWLFGLVGVVILIWLARRTLAVPNTQSATGIFYVAVIGAFTGETASLLLSAESVYPL